MKVGLLHTPAARLGAYWAALLDELEVDQGKTALDDAEALRLGQRSLPDEGGVVQLLLGRVLGMGRMDLVVAPALPGVSGDIWAADFAELLPRRFAGLPTIVGVPDAPEGIEEAAAGLAMRLAPRGGRVRLALERIRPLAQGPKAEMPALGRASRATVAVVGPRALLDEPLLAGPLRPALEALGLHPVLSPELPRDAVLQRAERLDGAERLPEGERELFGAASLLSGKSAVRGVVYAAPARDRATAAALERVAGRLHKPALHVALDGEHSDLSALEAFRDRITLGAGEHA